MALTEYLDSKEKLFARWTVLQNNGQKISDYIFNILTILSVKKSEHVYNCRIFGYYFFTSSSLQKE